MASTEDNILCELPRFKDPRGCLSVIESRKQVPFEIKRAYWIYDVPSGDKRDGHAFREQDEFIVALSGSFDVILHDGKKFCTVHLAHPYEGIFIPHMTWRNLENFATNSVALVLSSTLYDHSDYIESFEEFLQLKNVTKQ